MERSDKPLLDWLLLKHADTPKTRAKQWILAGRVSVRGKVIRKPHEKISDPGDTLELQARHATTLACDGGRQIHPRVSLLYLDASVAIVNKGAGLISVPASDCDLSALSILAVAYLVGLLINGATFGMALLGLKVTADDGSKAGLYAIAMRTVLLFLVIPAVVWDADGRGLHDRVARTVIVATR